MEILFEDNHLIIVNKKSGELVQADNTEAIALEDVLKKYIKEKYEKPGDVFLNAAHRLDRPTSGIVIFARTSKALARMNELFKTREVKKTYWAVTKNKPEKEHAHLVHYLVKNEKQNKSYASKEKKPNSVEAKLSYDVIGKSDNYFLLEINLETGRHHQIRSQLTAIGCPIKGDLKYGSARSNPDGSIHLHARRVEFIHPVSLEKMILIAPVPNDPLWKSLEK